LPRELRPELVALIDTGNYGMHTTHDIQLTDGTQLFLSSSEAFVDNVDKTQQYLARLNEIQALTMSVDIEADIQQFSATNVDKIIGQTLTGSVRQLDGASSIIGAIFIDHTKDFIPANLFWDARMPCILTSGEITDQTVAFTATSSVDYVAVSGRLIAEEFTWREPINTVPVGNPDDLGTSGGGGPSDPNDPFYGSGRYGDLGPPIVPMGVM
jgi:hypothetical protein